MMAEIYRWSRYRPCPPIPICIWWDQIISRLSLFPSNLHPRFYLAPCCCGMRHLRQRGSWGHQEHFSRVDKKSDESKYNHEVWITARVVIMGDPQVSWRSYITIAILPYQSPWPSIHSCVAPVLVHLRTSRWMCILAPIDISLYGTGRFWSILLDSSCLSVPTAPPWYGPHT